MRRGNHRDDGWRERRGQSNVIAVVLLAGLVVAGATVVVVAGSAAIEGDRAENDYETARQSMQSLESEIERSLRNEGPKTLDLQDIDSGDRTFADDGEITVTLEGSGGSSDSVSAEFGTIRYEQDDRTITYQNGALFESTGEGTAVVSNPEITYRDRGNQPTLSIPVVKLAGDGDGIDGDVRLEQQSASDLLADIDRSKFSEIGAGEPINPIRPGMEATIAIESDYYEAWGRILEERLEVGVNYDDANERVSFTLKGPDPTTTISASLTGVGSTLPVTNHGSTDSYDSSDGPYSTPANANGDVWTRGVYESSVSATIKGDLRAEQGVDKITNTIEVHGTTALGDNPSGKTSFAGGSPVFHDTFSTKDEFETAGSDVTFEGDVIVDNDVTLFDGSTVEDPGADEANMYVDGDAHIGSGAVIEGDLYVRGELEFSDNTGSGGAPRVKGDVVTTDQSIEGYSSEVTVDGNVRQPSSISDSELRDPLETDVPASLTDRGPSEVHSEFQSFSQPSNRDNTGATYVSGTGLTCGGLSECSKSDHQLHSNDDSNTIKLEAGDYYLDAIELHNTNLELDTSDGPINIYVSEYVSLGGTSEVTVPNDDNDVEIYIRGDGSASGNEFYMTGSSKVETVGDKAPLMSVYVDPSASIELNNGVKFTGLLHGGSSPGASFKITNHAEVYGSVIGDVSGMSVHATVHYDEALGESSLVSGASGDGRVLYLHMTSREVSVEG